LPRKKSIQVYELAKRIAELSLLKKAEDVVILDLRKLTTMSDYFVICSGDSDKQVVAITEAISDGLAEDKIKPWHTEGENSGTWVLMDFVDVVAHIFHKNSREYYKLEELWGDAEVTYIKDNNNEN
jgi:ribosome-associated protein